MPSGPRPTGIVRPTPYICGEPTDRGPCRETPAKGYNPLSFCACHLALYRERMRNPSAPAFLAHLPDAHRDEIRARVAAAGRSPTPMGATAPAVTMVLRAGPWRGTFRAEAFDG